MIEESPRGAKYHYPKALEIQSFHDEIILAYEPCTVICCAFVKFQLKSIQRKQFTKMLYNQYTASALSSIHTLVNNMAIGVRVQRILIPIVS